MAQKIEGKVIKFKFTGIRPLIMHSDLFADPTNVATIAHKALSSKRAKTLEDYERIAQSEWKGSLYWDKEFGPVLPDKVLFATIYQGAKEAKEGPRFLAAVQLMADAYKLDYDGPRDLQGLWDLGDKFQDRRNVVISRVRIMRCRPIFKQWSVTFDVVVDPDVYDPAKVIKSANEAGRLRGIGDYRPRFGRFSVEVM